MERVRMTEKEQAFLDALMALWPAEFGYPLDGDKDRATMQDVARLLEAGIVERVEATSPDGTQAAALYRPTDDYLASLGATDRPQDN